MSNKKQYCALDLFAGCGGLSEGFVQKGFDVVSHVEKNSRACETLRTRSAFHYLKAEDNLDLYHKYQTDDVPRDRFKNQISAIWADIENRVIEEEISEDSISTIINRLQDNLDRFGYDKYHVLLGGPPCQAYSVVGRARDDKGMEGDGRHLLYQFYLEILRELEPELFVFENVPGLISASNRGKKVFQVLRRDLEDLNPKYEIAPTAEKFFGAPRDYILNSNHFGVPQKRKRIFLIGYQKQLLEKSSELENIFRAIQAKQAKAGNKPVRTVFHAISDLPGLKPEEGNDFWYPEHPAPAMAKYQQEMREHSPGGGISNHRARSHMEEDLRRYEYFIKNKKFRENGTGSKNVTIEDLKADNEDLLPNHDNLSSFVDRFKVQFWDRPAYTITSHIRKDGHYYIHPDISQIRSFTVREAARCQSFPDSFIFEGPRTEQFNQVGNAVPPLLAEELAAEILKQLQLIHS